MNFKNLTILLIFFFSNCVIAQADLIFKNGMEFISKLNDTGITWGGDYESGNNTTCTSNIASPQDCHQGRDATHNDDSDGHAGFSFTKLDVSGVPLTDQSVDYATTPWSCVKDNVTGLVWEVKTDDGGIHDKDNTYRWGGVTHLGSNYGTYYNDWDVLVNGSNSENLCGFSGWRVPNIQELLSIVDNGRYSPSIDTDYFSNTTSSNFSYFKSASPNAKDSSYAHDVYFTDGSSANSYRHFYHYVRLVSFGQ